MALYSSVPSFWFVFCSILCFICFLLTCFSDCIISLICSLTSHICVHHSESAIAFHTCLLSQWFLWPFTLVTGPRWCHNSPLEWSTLWHCCFFYSIISHSSVLYVSTILLPVCCSLPSCCKHVFLFSRIGLSQLEGFRRQLLDVLQRSNKPKVRMKINRPVKGSVWAVMIIAPCHITVLQTSPAP